MRKGYKAHASDKKKEAVKQLSQFMDKYNYIAAVNMENLPAKQLQTIKETLRGECHIQMTKRRLLNIAIDRCKKENIQALRPHLKGMPAVLFTNQSPFVLYNTIKKNKSKAPIRAGQITPNDIVVKAGKTSFSPGPIIGELGAFRIKAGIEDGKVAIKQDVVVAKEGDIVDAKLAAILQRLGIEPMEIGLAVTAVYEKGDILRKDVLDIDEDAYYKDFQTAHASSIALAIEIGYITEETVELMVSKAHREAFALAVEADIITEDTLGLVLGKAEAQASELNKKINT